MLKGFIPSVLLIAAASAAAQDVTPRTTEPAAVVLAKPFPVTVGDIVDRPYMVLGPIRTTVQKNGVFGKRVSEQKVYKELWERGRKMGADAVIFADYTAPQAQFDKLGAREASGKAIKFVR